MGAASAVGSLIVFRKMEVIIRQADGSGLRAGRAESCLVCRGAVEIRQTPTAEGSLIAIRMRTKGGAVVATR